MNTVIPTPTISNGSPSNPMFSSFVSASTVAIVKKTLSSISMTSNHLVESSTTISVLVSVAGNPSQLTPVTIGSNSSPTLTSSMAYSSGSFALGFSKNQSKLLLSIPTSSYIGTVGASAATELTPSPSVTTLSSSSIRMLSSLLAMISSIRASMTISTQISSPDFYSTMSTTKKSNVLTPSSSFDMDLGISKSTSSVLLSPTFTSVLPTTTPTATTSTESYSLYTSLLNSVTTPISMDSYSLSFFTIPTTSLPTTVPSDKPALAQSSTEIALETTLGVTVIIIIMFLFIIIYIGRRKATGTKKKNTDLYQHPLVQRKLEAPPSVQHGSDLAYETMFDDDEILGEQSMPWFDPKYTGSEMTDDDGATTITESSEPVRATVDGNVRGRHSLDTTLISVLDNNDYLEQYSQTTPMQPGERPIEYDIFLKPQDRETPSRPSISNYWKNS